MLLSLHEYDSISRGMLKKYAKRFVDDDDAVGTITYYAINADLKFDGTKFDSRDAYRCFMARNGLKKWLRSRKRHAVGIKKYLESRREDSLVHRDREKQSDYIENLLSKCNLSDKQKDAIVKYFLEEMSMAEISKVLGCTKQAISERIDSGLEKLRKYVKHVGR